MFTSAKTAELAEEVSAFCSCPWAKDKAAVRLRMVKNTRNRIL
jgi:hypothetical protein